MKPITFDKWTNSNARATTTRSGRPSTPIMCGTALILTDQLSKFAADTAECGPLVCSLRNEALFLGVGAGSGVDAVAMGAIGLGSFILWVRAARRRSQVSPVAVAFVAAGIFANMIDRVATGSVRDFLAVPGGVVINLADVGVVGGLVVCVVTMATTAPTRSTSGRG